MRYVRKFGMKRGCWRALPQSGRVILCEPPDVDAVFIKIFSLLSRIESSLALLLGYSVAVEKWVIMACYAEGLRSIRIASNTGKTASVAINVYVLLLDAFLYSSSHFGPQYFSLMLTGAPQTVQ